MLLIVLVLIALGPAAIFVASAERRRVLRDRWALAAFVALPLVWSALLVGMFALSPPANGPLPRSYWPYLIILAALAGWAAAASGLIVRARGRRLAASLYALANAPGFFIVILIGGVIASGEWL